MVQEFPRPDLRPYLGKTVTIGIDRPMGYVHVKGEKTLVYPINYTLVRSGKYSCIEKRTQKGRRKLWEGIDVSWGFPGGPASKEPIC